MFGPARMLNNSRFKLINRYVAALKYNVVANRNRRKFIYQPPVSEGHLGFLYDFNVEGVFFGKFREHGRDVCSPPAGRVVEIKRDLHRTLSPNDAPCFLVPGYFPFFVTGQQAGAGSVSLYSFWIKSIRSGIIGSTRK